MNKAIRMLAWLEVLTGVFMLGDIALALFSSGSSAVFTLRNGALIAIGSLSLFAGIALFKSGRFAWCGSVLVQLLLVPVFSVGTLLYRPGVGVFVPLGVDMPGSGGALALYELTIGVDFMVSISAVRDQQYVAINFAALVCLVILLLRRPGFKGRV